MHITLLTNEVRSAWDPRQVRGQGLGGSEEAVTLWAEACARRGYTVDAYASLSASVGTHNGVCWRRREEFRIGEARDVLVTWKERSPWLIGASAARVCIHWSSDVETPQQWVRRAVGGLDAFVCLSAAHARACAWVGERLRIVPHGVGEEFLGALGEPPKASRAIYCASPDRGLDFVLRHWARIQATLGVDELAVTYPFPFAPSAPVLGVTFLPGLPVQQWESLLASCRYWIHPVHGPHGPVPASELFCLNAVKAQALGVMPVVPEAMVRASGLGDTVRRYIDLSALILKGDASVRENAAFCAPAVGWDEIVARYWEPLFAGAREVAA